MRKTEKERGTKEQFGERKCDSWAGREGEFGWEVAERTKDEGRQAGEEEYWRRGEGGGGGGR